MLNSQELVSVENGHPATTSLKVSEFFGKHHKHVMRDIENLNCSSDFRGSNFGLTSTWVQQPRGGKRKSKAYSMTKDGFTILVMGYTGKRAMEFKEAYIQAFNAMSEKLAEQERKRLEARRCRITAATPMCQRLLVNGAPVIPGATLTNACGINYHRLHHFKSTGALEQGRDFYHFDKKALAKVRPLVNNSAAFHLWNKEQGTLYTREGCALALEHLLPSMYKHFMEKLDRCYFNPPAELVTGDIKIELEVEQKALQLSQPPKLGVHVEKFGMRELENDYFDKRRNLLIPRLFAELAEQAGAAAIAPYLQEFNLLLRERQEILDHFDGDNEWPDVRALSPLIVDATG